MKLSSIFFAVVAAAGVFAQTPDPAINTPSGVQQCLPTQLTFSGTSPPFIITVVPAGQAGAAPLTTVGTTSANAITWVANLPLGDYTLVIRDSIGRTNPSGTFTILPGTDASCVGSSSAAASGAATSPAASSPAAATSQAAATTPATTPATSAAAATGSAAVEPSNSSSKAASVISSASAAATTSHNAAPTLQPLGIAGLVGLAGVAALL